MGVMFEIYQMHGNTSIICYKVVFSHFLRCFIFIVYNPHMIGKHYAEYEHPRSKMESDFAFLAVDWFEVYYYDLDLRF